MTCYDTLWNCMIQKKKGLSLGCASSWLSSMPRLASQGTLPAKKKSAVTHTYICLHVYTCIHVYHMCTYIYTHVYEYINPALQGTLPVIDMYFLSLSLSLSRARTSTHTLPSPLHALQALISPAFESRLRACCIGKEEDEADVGVAVSRSGTCDSWPQRESWLEGSCAPVTATPAAVVLFDANLNVWIGETVSAASSFAGLCTVHMFQSQVWDS